MKVPERAATAVDHAAASVAMRIESAFLLGIGWLIFGFSWVVGWRSSLVVLLLVGVGGVFGAKPPYSLGRLRIVFTWREGLVHFGCFYVGPIGGAFDADLGGHEGGYFVFLLSGPESLDFNVFCCEFV